MTDELKSTEYTYAEKLELVAQGQMAPEEIGCATIEEARDRTLEVLGDAPPKPHLGDFCTLEVSEVPPKLRALWAKQERKIIDPAENFELEWMEENKDKHLLQARLRCGNFRMMLEQEVADVVLGFAAILAQAGGILEQMKARMDAGEFDVQVKKDPLLEAKPADAIVVS